MSKQTKKTVLIILSITLILLAMIFGVYQLNDYQKTKNMEAEQLRDIQFIYQDYYVEFDDKNKTYVVKLTDDELISYIAEGKLYGVDSYEWKVYRDTYVKTSTLINYKYSIVLIDPEDKSEILLKVRRGQVEYDYFN